MNLMSPAFGPGDPIPPRYTCDGENVSPELRWDGVPDGTIIVALACLDPDAPAGAFTHWLLWDVDPSTTRIPSGEVPIGARQGRNDFGNVRYDGPCPPPGHGTHRYRFTLYAAAERVGLPSGAVLAQLLSALSSTTIGTAELVGTYAR